VRLGPLPSHQVPVPTGSAAQDTYIPLGQQQRRQWDCVSRGQSPTASPSPDRGGAGILAAAAASSEPSPDPCAVRAVLELSPPRKRAMNALRNRPSPAGSHRRGEPIRTCEAIHAHRRHSAYCCGHRARVIARQAQGNPAADMLRRALISQPLALNDELIVCPVRTRCGGVRVIACQAPSNPTTTPSSPPPTSSGHGLGWGSSRWPLLDRCPPAAPTVNGGRAAAP